MGTDVVQDAISNLDKVLKMDVNSSISEDLYIKKIFERRNIFLRNYSIKDKIYYELDKFFNSFSSSNDKEKLVLIIIKLTILIITLNKQPYEQAYNDIITSYNDEVDRLLNHLLDKNRKYGNSALNPIRIISTSNTIEQLYIRIDDKLNRLINRQNDEDEDLPFDIAGYFILVLIYFKLNKE